MLYYFISVYKDRICSHRELALPDKLGDMKVREARLLGWLLSTPGMGAPAHAGTRVRVSTVRMGGRKGLNCLEQKGKKYHQQNLESNVGNVT